MLFRCFFLTATLFLISKLPFSSSDLRAELFPQCKDFGTKIDKSLCRQHYFVFVFVLLRSANISGHKEDPQTHLEITKNILRPCLDFESTTTGTKSVVMFADHDWKIDQTETHGVDEVMKMANLTYLYDYIVIDKDVNSVDDLDQLIMGATDKMVANPSDVQYAVIFLLNSPDYFVMDLFGASVKDFGFKTIKSFKYAKVISRLIFTYRHNFQLSTTIYLDYLKDVSEGYFDYVVDEMTDEKSIAENYGMCTGYRKPKEKSSTLNVWVPLVAVGGTLLLATIICIALAWFGVLNAPARRLHDFLETKLDVTVNWLDVEDGENMFGSGGRIKRVNDEWEVDQLTLHVSNQKLGSGAYASVYSATLSGLPPVVKAFPNLQQAGPLFMGGDNTIAVKSPHVHISPQERREFFREIAFMKNLDYHPHLLCMLGCSTDPKTPMILLELCELGDLHSIVKKMAKIEKRDGKMDDVEIEKAKNALKVDDFVSVAWQVADALCYLVDKQIIHRDIAARNVLLNLNKVAKLSDFGLCRQSDEMWYSSRGGKLPLRWMAPESIEMAAFSAPTDIWSFGVLLWEAYSFGTVPFPTVATEDVLSHLKKGNRLHAPDNAPPFMAALMESCWEWDPSLRPTAEKARTTFYEFLEAQGIAHGYTMAIAENAPSSSQSSNTLAQIHEGSPPNQDENHN
ncbi:unnamed protein product, partial [Mesorhabditis belari]|uniref:receptor protein-tyrosine kinase n=1 Tax=Mesorhabditis belari TaxID=2138241 RepID=A0AAF3FJF1_9BILA